MNNGLAFLLLALVAATLMPLYVFPDQRGGGSQQQEQKRERDVSSAVGQEQQKSNSKSKSNNKNDDPPIFYSGARTDRAGASIMDMLMAHAYAYSKGGVYGGACRIPQDRPMPMTANGAVVKDTKLLLDQRDAEKLRLLQFLGVDKLLPYGMPCPTDPIEYFRSYITMSEHYGLKNNDLNRFPPGWLEHIQSQVAKHGRKIDNKNDSNNSSGAVRIRNVAVHMRRGDVSPCKYFAERYLPNAYYLQTIDEFMRWDQQQQEKDTQKANIRYNVTIFTESDVFEPLQDFTDLGFNVFVEDDLPRVWYAMMTADIFIMGRSSFSTVPALLNRHGTMVYAPYKFKPLPQWKRPSKAIVTGIVTEVDRLRKEHCPKLKWKRKRLYDPSANKPTLVQTRT